MNNWLTISEMAEKTGIPHQTIRRYMSKHAHHLLMKKKHKSYLISDESTEIIQKVRSLYSEGKNVEEVDNVLASMGVPMSITVEADEKKVSINLAEVIQKQGEALIQIQEEMREQRALNEKLLEQMKKQQEYIEQKLEVRDQKLMEALNQSIETRKQLASSKQEEEKKKGFWTRLFGI